MANVGKQQVSSKQLANIGQKKSILEPAKFPQLGQNVTAPTATTDLSDYRQPQPGEAIANLRHTLSTSKSTSPPNYLTAKQLPAPKRQEREANNTSVNQLKAPHRVDMLQPEVAQGKLTIGRSDDRYGQEDNSIASEQLQLKADTVGRSLAASCDRPIQRTGEMTGDGPIITGTVPQPNRITGSPQSRHRKPLWLLIG